MRVRRAFFRFIAVFQSVLFLAHFFLYETWAFALPASAARGLFWVKIFLGFSSLSFVAASLLAFRYTNPVLRGFYRVAAVWLGLLTFLFVAALTSWIVLGVARLLGLAVNSHRIVEVLFGVAVVARLCGVLNSSWTRITRIT